MPPKNPDKPVVQRVNLAKYWHLLPKQDGKPASANWLAQQIGVTHNTILYYLEHYQKDLDQDKQIRQPSYVLIKALADFFAQFGVTEADLIEWSIEPGDSEGDDPPPKNGSALPQAEQTAVR